MRLVEVPPRYLGGYRSWVAVDVRRLGRGSPKFPDASSQFWNLVTENWEPVLAPPRDLVGYGSGFVELSRTHFP
jgi:hypothetical protein